MFEEPVTAPRSLIAVIPSRTVQAATSVPRSVITPFCQRTRPAASPSSVEKPTTSPSLLTPLAALYVPIQRAQVCDGVVSVPVLVVVLLVLRGEPERQCQRGEKQCQPGDKRDCS